jgi:Phosphotransferase enzyme family
MGLNEIEWVKTHATPRMNYHRSMEEPESPSEFLALLARYMDVSRHLVPPSIDGEIHANTLWHPDLHLDNVFVDPDSRKITRIVDWQSAAVAPIFLHCGVPKLFRHRKPVSDDWAVPDKPQNYDRLTDEEKKEADYELESEICHKYYRYQTYKKNPRHWAALTQDHIPIRTKSVWLVTGAWQNRDVFFLRQSLIDLAKRWRELEPNAGPCPISFTERELELHANEDENMTGVGELLKTLRDEGMLPADGMVDPADYTKAREICQKYKRIFVGLANGEEQRRLFSKIWPYQETEDEVSHG